MEKKKYICPKVEETFWNTRELMFTETASGEGTPKNPAPVKREVF